MAHYVFSGHPRGKIYTTIKQELPDLDKAQRLVDDVEVLHQQCEAHEMMLDSLETDLASKDREIAHLTTRLNDLSSQLKLQKVINKETLLEKQECMRSQNELQAHVTQLQNTLHQPWPGGTYFLVTITFCSLHPCKLRLCLCRQGPLPDHAPLACLMMKVQESTLCGVGGAYGLGLE